LEKDSGTAEGVRRRGVRRRRCSVDRMEGLLIGFIWLVVIVGGGIAAAAIVQMVKSPYRDR